ncbi:MAG TPA: hypothetical protein VF158_04415 [Longimicrobiales bacterium]
MNADAFEIRPIRTIDEARLCVTLQREVWGEEFSEVVPPAILWAAQKIGGITAGAFDGAGRLAAFVFGMTGVEDGRLVHWSDMLAVRPDLRDRGLGTRLKRFQRDALLRLGVETVYWTFDPLESKNAYLNFARLGIVARTYHRDLYGQTASPVHEGIGTDRLVAVWEIGGERVRRRLAGEPAPTAADVADAPLANPTRPGPAGPECLDPDLALDADRIRIAVPSDIQRLKAAAPELARDWRRKTRAAFEAYLGRGYVAVEVVRDGDRSDYVLGRAERRALTS